MKAALIATGAAVRAVQLGKSATSSVQFALLLAVLGTAVILGFHLGVGISNAFTMAGDARAASSANDSGS